ncbi:hypothetical protein [Luteimonas fraxinea]|uniref:Uncharacterized protein n=1 Tax=Luteimonas fraxinea TaxID=2901869 RepID=A0ABS8UDE1_9GAMM|nr:hypothetical protein [Luteimonas fraxinea]MCD9096535.1 hypothetical protein [Luteimonas fraxinea]
MKVRHDSTTVRLLDGWKMKKGIVSDHEAWQVLKLSGQSAISNWRMGRSHAEPLVAARMAKDIGMSVAEILMNIEGDRAKRQAIKSLWYTLAVSARSAAAIALVAAVLPLLPAQASTQSESSHAMYIMRSSR